MRSRTWMTAAAVTLGLGAATWAGSGQVNSGRTSFSVDTPNGGNTLFDTVSTALRSSVFNATTIRKGLDTSTRPATVTSFEVSSHPAFVFDVERLLHDSVTTGQTFAFDAPAHLSLTDLDDTAGIVGPDDRIGEDQIDGPQQYVITVYAGTGTSAAVKLGVLTGATGVDAYTDDASGSGSTDADGHTLDSTVHTYVRLTIANPWGSGGTNAFPAGSIALEPAGARQIVLRHHAPIVVAEGETRAFWVTEAGDLLPGGDSYVTGAMIGSLTARRVVVGALNGDEGYLFPEGTPGLHAAEIEVISVDASTNGGQVVDGFADDRGADAASILNVNWAMTVSIRNVYSKTSSGGYELASSTNSTTSAYVRSDHEIPVGTVLKLSKSLVPVYEVSPTQLLVDDEGRARLGLFDE